MLRRREDGFHGLRSVMVPLELADTIHVEPAPEFAFFCDDAALAGEENLAVRAVRAIETASGARIAARIRLHKNVPSRAGLGGGSSDAAAVLRAAASGVLGALPSLDWLAIARALGSDVPFFLAETAALVEGTGGRVTALGAIPAWGTLVVKPPVDISTAEAYERLDRHERPIRRRADSPSLRCVEALQRADLAAVESLLTNDFHALALEEPAIALAHDALRAAGAAAPLLAGSGAALFALMPDAASRDAVTQRLQLPPGYTVFATAFAKSRIWQ